MKFIFSVILISTWFLHFGKKNILNSKLIPSDVKSYHEFCTVFVQLIKVQARITTSSSTTIDHILASYPERLIQWGVIDISLSDHQLIYCTRKISRIKRGSHKQIQFRSLNGPSFWERIIEIKLFKLLKL